MDPLELLPQESRREVVDAVSSLLGVSTVVAESVVRSSQPLWEPLEEAGLVDGWGGMEYIRVFPTMLSALVEALRPPSLDEVLALVEARRAAGAPLPPHAAEVLATLEARRAADQG